MRSSMAVTLSLFALGGSAAFGADTPAAVAPAGAIQIIQPYNKAVVRESVPVKLREFPSGGYVSVSIDGQFITAQALPRNRTAPVFVWDTKASHTDPDNPDTPKTYNDGAHAITVAVYDTQNKLVGQDSVSVQVADKINLPASQGVRLLYPWKQGLSLRYQRRTTLTAAPTDASTAASVQTLQESLLRFGRTVENVSEGASLLRDEIIPVDRSVHPKAFVSYVATHGQSQTLSSAFHARYREVDDRGQILSVLTSQNSTGSVGFSIPVLPPHRVSVGAHWQSPVQITLDWTSPYPATVQATSTLEGFEWQDRYPTAKIRETYEGPATFYPAPGSAVPAITNQDIKLERIVYFAYNAGRVVRTQTTLTLVSTEPGLLNASPGPSGYPSAPGGRGGFNRPGGPPAGYQGGPPPIPTGPPTGYPGGPPPGFNFAPPPGYSGGPPSGDNLNGGDPNVPGGSPGGPPPTYQGGAPPPYQGGYPGAQGPEIQAGGPVKLTYTEISVLLT